MDGRKKQKKKEQMDGIPVVHEGDVLVAEVSASLRSFVSHGDMLKNSSEMRAEWASVANMQLCMFIIL